MKLSKRLELVASFVPEGSRLADVGTDHGYIPIALVERGVCPFAIAMDVGTGPLARAREHIQERGLSGQISTRLSDGMEALHPGEADAVVMAGMGGELVIHILERGRRLWKCIPAYILSPQSELEKVRHYLDENGFSIRKEDMVMEEGKYYTVMLAEQANAVEKNGLDQEEKRECWYRYGKDLIQQKNPVLLSFLDKEEQRVLGILSGLEAQNTPGAKTARQGLEEELRQIKEARDEMRGNH